MDVGNGNAVVDTKRNEHAICGFGNVAFCDVLTGVDAGDGNQILKNNDQNSVCGYKDVAFCVDVLMLMMEIKLWTQNLMTICVSLWGNWIL